MIRVVLLFLLVLSTFEKSDVYFTKEISPEKIVEMFKKLNVTLKGKVGLKVHTGEKNGPYYLRPSFLKNIYEYTKGTFIECNVAYTGSRHNTEVHRELLKLNGWSDYNTVIMDEDENKDKILEVKNHHNISKNYVGEHLTDFNSCLVLAHFKGHGMGGFGGALKQLSIGFASKKGKNYIHSAGATTDSRGLGDLRASQLDFTSSMADAASTIVDYFKNDGGIAYINVLVNISNSCDCAGVRAPEPRIRDIGILASTDPVAIDKACYDLIVKENNEGSQDWVKQSETKLGLNTLKIAVEHKLGTEEYNLIDIDNDGKDDSDTDKGGKDEGGKGNNKGEDNSGKGDNNLLLYILIPIASVVVIGVIIFLVYYFMKKKKNENLIVNEDIGETVPEDNE